MGKTLEEQKDLLNIQYVLESLIEYYELAQKESDKYYIKGQLLEFIDDFDVSLDFIKEYLELQPEKFEPFIKTLSNVNYKSKVKKKEMHFNQDSPEIKMYVYRK